MEFPSLKIKSVLLTLSLLLSGFICSQNFTGKITDKNNQPVYGSTVFIKELSQGLACNDEGEFQTTLPAGNYTVEFRCLGYENVTENISISKNNDVIKNIVLTEKTFELSQIVVTNKEDPAYEIIRQAIKKAPYYRNIIKSYKAEAYIKGNMELTKISKIMDKLASTDEGFKMSDIKNKDFIQESFSEIEFTAPDQYIQTVKGFSSTAPDDFNPKDAMQLMQTSLYSPMNGGIVLPLNPKAFSYYKFRYEGFLEEDGQNINKIRVIAKLKDPQLLNGYLYIADDTWDIRYAEIVTNMYGINQEITITYNKVMPGIYLPTAYNNMLLADIFGIGGNFKYSSSVKYTDIVRNDSINEDSENKKKKEKKSLEIKFNKNYTMKDDSLATKRDSLYWAEIRNVPLNDKEIASYLRKDSIQHHIDSVRKDYHDSKFDFSDILTGGRIGGDSAKFTFEYGGLIKAMPEYNFVDGFLLGQKFKISRHFSNNNRLSLSPKVYYTTARKNIIWGGELTFDYSPNRFGRLTMAGGDISADYNSNDGSRLDNTISSLVDGKNVSMLFRKKYINAFNTIDLANGLSLTTGFEIAKRSGLHNNTHYNFFNAKSKIKTNIYQSGNFDLAAYLIGIRYTPRHYYTMDNGKKSYRYAKSPTLYVMYSEGFSSWLTNNSKFRKLRGGITQTIRTDIFTQINYHVQGGTFIGDKDKINFADYNHFNATDLFFVDRPLSQLFMLLGRYEASTNKYWLNAHVDYTSQYILLKRLPFLQGKLFGESVQLKYLYTPTKKNYMEAGYSIHLFKAINAGIFCSFDKFKYDGFGVRLLLNTSIFD